MATTKEIIKDSIHTNKNLSTNPALYTVTKNDIRSDIKRAITILNIILKYLLWIFIFFNPY